MPRTFGEVTVVVQYLQNLTNTVATMTIDVIKNLNNKIDVHTMRARLVYNHRLQDQNWDKD